MKTTLLDLRFKGNRNYLQGPDIFNAIMGVLEEQNPSSILSDIDIVFRQLARRGLTFLSALPQGVEPVVQFSYRINGERRKFCLIDDGRPILGRNAYREEEIVAATNIHVDTSTATCSALLPYTNIERWVAMIKAMHHALYPNLVGQWLFVRGKFMRYAGNTPDTAVHQVVLEANFNGKLTRSAVSIGGEKLGDIFFSLR